MSYNSTQFKDKLKGGEEWLLREFESIRTGRAAPAILDNISVESYGSRMPIRQMATVNIEDARTLRVAPYDATQIKALEKAVTSANLGLSVSSDEKGLRISFPELTSERRTILLKTAKEKLEQSKVTIRKHRDDSVREIDAMEKKKEISEDEKFRSKAEIQKIVDEANKKLETIYQKKEKEING